MLDFLNEHFLAGSPLQYLEGAGSKVGSQVEVHREVRFEREGTLPSDLGSTRPHAARKERSNHRTVDLDNYVRRRIIVTL